MPDPSSPNVNEPVVEAIHVSLATRLPMRSVPHAEVRTGGGIVGDRYEHSRHRHVTVQSAEQLAAAGEAFGAAIEPGATRRNITLSRGEIPARPGDRFSIGDVELEVVRIAAPCRLMDDLIGDGAKEALRRRAGSVCRVLVGGTLSVGDPARL